MRSDTQTIRPVATLDAVGGTMPQRALGTPAMRWAATLLTIAAVLLACGLAVVMNLS